MPDPANAKRVRAAVAPRHTIMVGEHADRKKGKPSTLRACGPGTVLEFPAEEAAHLMRAGFLTNPDAAPVTLGPGPTYGQDGNMIHSPGDGG